MWVKWKEVKKVGETLGTAEARAGKVSLWHWFRSEVVAA